MADRDTDLNIYEPHEVEEGKELPIKRLVWENAPTEEVNTSIVARSSEFFRSPEIPPEVKVMGLFSQELMLKTSQDLGNQSYLQALYTNVPYAGPPTLEGVALYKDRIDFAFTPIPRYGEFSVDVVSTPIPDLDRITGGVVGDIARDAPQLVDTLLSTSKSEAEKAQAKVDLMRYLSKAKPDRVLAINQAGLLLNEGLAFVPFEQNACVKLYIDGIPESDPVLGGTMEFRNLLTIYKKTEMMLSKDEFSNMTTEKIEGFLKRLPRKMQEKLMGKYPETGIASFRIFHLLQKFGYKGSEASQKFDKVSNLGIVFVGFSNELNGRIMKSITEGKNLEELGLDNSGIDKLFRETYASYKDRKPLPDSFSITDVILNKVPIESVNV